MRIVKWHEARQVPSWLIFDVRLYPILSGRSRSEVRFMMRQHAVGSYRAMRTTPAKSSRLLSARIGVRVLEHSVLALSSEDLGCTNVSIAGEALKF
jgi:hypothetical protein